MRCNHVDKGLRTRLRDYFHRTRHLHDASNQKRLLSMMSPMLQSELVLSVNARWLRHVWFLQNEAVEDQFIVSLTMTLNPMVLAPFELAPFGFLYILYRGVVTIGGDLLTRGKTWGEDIILEAYSPAMRRFINAKAINYAEVYLMDWPALAQTAVAFPSSGMHIRRCALRLAMRRQLVRHAAAAKRAARREKREAAIASGQDASALNSFKRAKTFGNVLQKTTVASEGEISLQTQLINIRRAASQGASGLTPYSAEPSATAPLHGTEGELLALGTPHMPVFGGTPRVAAPAPAASFSFPDKSTRGAADATALQIEALASAVGQQVGPHSPECPRPIASCTRPIASCTRPIASCTRPIASCPRPIASCPRPIASCTRLAPTHLHVLSLALSLPPSLTSLFRSAILLAGHRHGRPRRAR